MSDTNAAPMTPPAAPAQPPQLAEGEHRCHTAEGGETWVPCSCPIGVDHTVADLEQMAAAEADAALDPEQKIRETAEADAVWIETVFTRERRPDLLSFLRFRPHRELVDILAAARRLGLQSAAEIVDGARRLAANHTGSPSLCPPGYAAVIYPADEADVRKALDGLADYLRRASLPGGAAFLGWNVGVEVEVDYEGQRVAAVLTVVLPS